MSPARATLLQSPGWNKGKARYGTLGKHRQKQIELRRSGTYPRKQIPQGYKYNEHNTTTQLRKRPIRQRALKGRHSCIAQGGMRAKPDMKPWGHIDKSGLSSVGAALTHASKCPNGYVKPRTATTQTKCALLVPPLKGLNKYVSMINPGLAPWALQEYRPLGAHCPNATINTPNPPQYHKQYNQTIQKHERTQQSIYTPQNI